MNETPYSAEQAHAAWNKIFEVLKPPPHERIQFLRPGYEIQAGDFAWATANDKKGMVHLTGYNEKLLNIWYADLELSEVRYIGPKPTSYPKGKNPFPVKPPTISARLIFGRVRNALVSRRLWWKVRDIRRQNLLKYGKETIPKL